MSSASTPGEQLRRSPAPPPARETLKARVEGMDCGSCARTIAVDLRQLPGVSAASVSFASQRLEVDFDPRLTRTSTILARVEALGYSVVPEHQGPEPAGPGRRRQGSWEFWLRSARGRTVLLSALALLAGALAARLLPQSPLPQALYALSMVIGIRPIIGAAWIALRRRQADMNLLMSLAAIGAVVLGQWFQGALVIVLFGLGTTLQSFALSRTRHAIRELMELAPATATVRRQGQLTEVPVDAVGVGERLCIRPGQRIPLDGTVLLGESEVDQSAITGEWLPQPKARGDGVYAGTLNRSGYLEVAVSRCSGDTTVARIIELVEEAQESRAPIQQWVDRFSAIYTPIVLALALAIVLVPPLLLAQPLQPWLYKGLVLLVIACPCGLVIATPVSLISAIGAASRQGVLFKGGGALEAAGRLRTLAFDKTGTITRGEPVVQAVHPLADRDEAAVLRLAASLEQRSEHPISRAIVAEADRRGIELAAPQSFQALLGRGVAGSVGTLGCWAGNRLMATEQGLVLSPAAEALAREIESDGATPVLVGCGQEVLGAIAVSDEIREEAAEAIEGLRRLGLRRLLMLTGDRTPVARRVAGQVGIREYRAEQLPEDKLRAIGQCRRSGPVGMVGDGINDTPALAAADVSFAVGRLDLALDTADVVLVGDDLRRLAYAIGLSRRTLTVIRQNITVALLLNAAFVVLGVIGVIGLPLAVLEDMGSSLLVTINALRLFHSR